MLRGNRNNASGPSGDGKALPHGLGSDRDREPRNPMSFSGLVAQASHQFKQFIDRDYRDEHQRKKLYIQFSDLRAVAEERSEGLGQRLDEIEKRIEGFVEDAEKASRGRKQTMSERILLADEERESVSVQFEHANQELQTVQRLLWKLEEVARRPTISGPELEHAVRFLELATEKARVATDRIEETQGRVADLGLEPNARRAAERDSRVEDVMMRYSKKAQAPETKEEQAKKSLEAVKRRISEH